MTIVGVIGIIVKEHQKVIPGLAEPFLNPSGHEVSYFFSETDLSYAFKLL